MEVIIDGKKYDVKESAVGKEIIKDKDVVALKDKDGNIIDMITPLKKGAYKTIKISDKEAISLIWHTSAHLLAYAVKKLFPNAKPTIGPNVEDGFYYDFADLKISEEDLAKIEKEVKKLLKENYIVEREEISKEKAMEMFKDNRFKLELIEEALERGEKLTIYKIGEFIDLCRGPHLPETKYIGAFKIMKTSGAYWKGDVNNPQLTRIYAVAYRNKEELEKYLKLLEEAKKRDHRVIGKQLDLFSVQEEGPGFPFWHPKGYRIYRALEDYMRSIIFEEGYVEVKTPIILNKSLWLRSGHWDHYKENMYFTKIDEQEYAIKPMNCPGHILIYKSRPRSYKELPLRIAEFGLVHRHELSGVLSGLFRVRAFTQDDAHIFCREDQIKEEIKKLLKIIDRIYTILGFKYKVFLSTRPEKFMGKLELWEKAENALKEALEEAGVKYKINEGEGAFYGPKIDVEVEDALGREWQCATIQVDFQMPEKFELTYMGEDGTYNHRPVMIHRALYGSMERFIGVLIEHFAGKMPLWVSFEHVRIIPVGEKHIAYCEEIAKKLRKERFYVSIDKREATLSKKIREAQLEKVNYVVVVGDKEVNGNVVNVRARDNKFQVVVSIEKFIEGLKKERDLKLIESKKELFE